MRLEKQKNSITEIGEQLADKGCVDSILRFFVGYDRNKLNALNKRLNEIEGELERAENLFEDIILEEEEEAAIDKIIQNEKEKIYQQRNILSERENSFSVFGWVRDIFL